MVNGDTNLFTYYAYDYHANFDHNLYLIFFMVSMDELKEINENFINKYVSLQKTQKCFEFSKHRSYVSVKRERQRRP